MAGRAEFVAYPGSCLDHWYIHRLGQSQDCELRGLAERNRTRQLNGGPGNGRVGGVHFVVKGQAECPGPIVLPDGPFRSIGRCGKDQVT
jgi:hypothetical protein